MSALTPAMAPAPAAARPWLPTWQAGHARAAAVALSAVVLAAVFAPRGWAPAVELQLVALIAAVAVFGVPHGALDPLVGRRWLAPRLGPRWWAPFHAAYVLLAAAVVTGWALAPAATLVGFLAASAVHFGLGDVDRTRSPRYLAWAEVLARGAAPVVVPAAAHPAAVAQAFAWVTPAASPADLAAVVRAASALARWAVVPACVAFALAHGAGAFRAARASDADCTAARRRVAHRTDALECLAVPAVAAALPPFLAFLAYFCLLHSARHALTLAAALDPARPRRAWARFARAALPATAATLAFGAAAWAVLARAGPRAGEASTYAPAAARVLFAGLAALTAPHMLLTALAGELGADEDEGPASARAVAPRPVQLVPQRPHRDA